MDIVVVGQQPWDVEIGSNCKNIALEFSERHRVLYVNSPLDRISMIRGRGDEKVRKRLQIVAGKMEGLHKIKDRLWNLYPNQIIESINWIKNDWLYTLLNKWNNKRFAKSIAAALKDLDFKDYILFNDSDMFRSFYLKELLQPKLTVYYSRDYLLATEYYKYHGEKLEPQLINKSSLCVANSTYLANYCKKYNPNSYYVGQGCDLSLFTETVVSEKPADIRNIKGPIIGYVGMLYSVRLDINIIRDIALNHPEWQIVLVGLEDDTFKASLLHAIDNVHFLGRKEMEELPAYIECFDVCINPQILTELTIGNYPRKVDEYLAMGKPVVATRTEAMEIFEDYVYLADEGESYSALIELALVEDSDERKQQRKSFVSQHTWANNVKEIYNAIDHVTKAISA